MLKQMLKRKPIPAPSMTRVKHSPLSPTAPASAGSPALQLFPLPFAAEVRPGDSLPAILLDAGKACGFTFAAGDILVVKHKIVSKAEGCIVRLADVTPSAATVRWAKANQLDPRTIGLALREAKKVLRRKHVLITETRHGFICANSGIDVSNMDGGEHALLLPPDPDRSATKLMRALQRTIGLHIPVIISDSFGRAWREGLTEVAIGVAGMKALHDYRGRRDPHGYLLRASEEAVADELACAAGLACGKLQRAPACVIRGFAYQRAPGSAKSLLRPAKRDLFR